MNMTESEFDLYVCRKLQRKAVDAKARGIGFTMTFTSMKNLMRAKRCFYTGVALAHVKSDNVQLPNTMTIDRIDSDRPYEKGNVVACSYAFNQMKAQIEKAGPKGLRMMAKAFDKAAVSMEKVNAA